ncbi:MAG: starch synthase, partial [Acutalibacteraceae bacterium]|nr:starch synthase [Acutalibacteraceae bacterium]
YGTIPIVRQTGGLNDTITDSGDNKGNGFTFSSYNAHDMLETIWRSIAGFSDKEGWAVLRERAMKCDNSWGTSANAYIRLYKEIVNN